MRSIGISAILYILRRIVSIRFPYDAIAKARRTQKHSEDIIDINIGICRIGD